MRSIGDKMFEKKKIQFVKASLFYTHNDLINGNLCNKSESSEEEFIVIVHHTHSYSISIQQFNLQTNSM